MKKLLVCLSLIAGLVGCSSRGGVDEDSLRVGMVTNSGTVNDKSFNEGTWNGIQRFEAANPGVVAQYLQPSNSVTTEFIENAGNLVSAGNEIIFVTGFMFDEAVLQLQEMHPEVKFVIIDGEPEVVAENTSVIYFAEEEAGFLAGVAAALESKSGQVGFIGGIKSPPVEHFGLGFVAGVAYANQEHGLDVQVVDFQYQGSFDNVEAGKTLAGGMYDKGIDVIFAAAGAVGNGVISEAKTRAENGESVFVIGVDSDQFDEGLMPDGSSVILTSAIKRVDNAAYEYLNLYHQGKFPGGEIRVLDAKQDGVGLPEINPNLAAETTVKVDLALEKIKDGSIVVPRTVEALTAWFDEVGYVNRGLNF